MSEAQPAGTRLIAAMRAITRAAAGDDLAALLASSATAVAAATSSDRVAIYVLDAETGELHLAESHGYDGPNLDRYRVLGRESISRRTAARLEARAFPAADLGEPVASQLRADGFVQLGVVPLHVKGKIAGSMNLARAEDVAYSSSDLEAATALGEQIAVQIERLRLETELRRLYDAERRRAADLASINQLGAVIAQELDLPAVLAAGLRHLGRIVDVTQTFLLLVDERGVARMVSSTVDEPDVLAIEVNPGESSIVARAVAERRPVVVQDTSRYDEPFSRDRVRRFGQTALLAVPLVTRGAVIGVALLGDTRAGRAFDEADVERAVAVSNQLATAISTARLFEDLRGSYAKLERAQTQLVQRERLAALGELSASVAHEVRNPLGVIFNSLASLRKLVPDRNETTMLLDIAEEESRRLNRIVSELLDFARPTEPQVVPQPIGPIVAGAVEAASAALGERASRIAIDAEATPPIPIDADMVRRAVINLVVNALQASDGPVRVHVRVREEPAKSARTLRIDVNDTGSGIPADIAAHVFEPFFTTKAKGTGLGLAIVKRVAEAHRGSVELVSRPGATTFTLRLPVTENP